MDEPKVEPQSNCAEQPQPKAFSSGKGVKPSKPSWRKKIGDTILKALNLREKTQKAGAGREMVGKDTNLQLESKRREKCEAKLRPRRRGRSYLCASVDVGEDSRERRKEEWESQLNLYNLLSW